MSSGAAGSAGGGGASASSGSGGGGSGGGAASRSGGAAAAGAEHPLQKQARIKTSVVTRLEKELLRYEEELAGQAEKVSKMRGAGADAHDIKQQVREICLA
jgi:hypothetical protein